MGEFVQKGALFLVASIFLLSSCRSVSRSLKKRALDSLVESLAEGNFSNEGNLLTQEEDPQLVAEVLPVVLKLSEALVEMRPESAEVHFLAGQSFVAYGGGFLLWEAEQLVDPSEVERQKKLYQRAKALLLRGRDYLLKALEIRHPGIQSAFEAKDLKRFISVITREDMVMVSWLIDAWLGAYGADPVDFELGMTLPFPIALIVRGIQLDETVREGVLHKRLIQVNKSLLGYLFRAVAESPLYVGSFLKAYYARLPLPQERLWYHFFQAERLSSGADPSLYTTMATSVAVPKQNSRLFVSLLERALSIDPDLHMANRTSILLGQERAKWMLARRQDFIPDVFDDEATGEVAEVSNDLEQKGAE